MINPNLLVMEHIKSKIGKCRATGKVIFPSQLEARCAMFRFKLRSRVKSVTDGRRIKHRMGKPACRRAYYCRLCKGYHITKWKRDDFERYKKMVLSWDVSSVLSDYYFTIL